jgi:hypothetical protein
MRRNLCWWKASWLYVKRIYARGKVELAHSGRCLVATGDWSTQMSGACNGCLKCNTPRCAPSVATQVVAGIQGNAVALTPTRGTNYSELDSGTTPGCGDEHKVRPLCETMPWLVQQLKSTPIEARRKACIRTVYRAPELGRRLSWNREIVMAEEQLQ